MTVIKSIVWNGEKKEQKRKELLKTPPCQAFEHWPTMQAEIDGIYVKSQVLQGLPIWRIFPRKLLDFKYFFS